MTNSTTFRGRSHTLRHRHSGATIRVVEQQYSGYRDGWAVLCAASYPIMSPLECWGRTSELGMAAHECRTAADAARVLRQVWADLDAQVVREERAMRARYAPPAAVDWVGLVIAARQRIAKSRTVADVLACREAREAVYSALRRGKWYTDDTDYYARRNVVADVWAILQRREQRRAARLSVATYRPIDRLRALAAERKAQREDDARAAIAAVFPFVGRLYRVGPHFDKTLRLDATAAVDFAADRKWVSGRGGYGWVTQSTHATIAVAPDWLDSVHARGLAACDGLVTTHASPVHADAGIEVYRASWLRQTAGYGVRVESGLIARDTASGTTYHVAASSDPRKAISGLKRKMTVQGISPIERAARKQRAAEARAANQQRGLARLAARFAKYDIAEIEHVVVTRRDSLQAGNCAPGTDEFGARLFPGRDRATIGEIVAAIGPHAVSGTLTGDALTLARQIGAACLVAIRHDRNARRALLS